MSDEPELLPCPFCNGEAKSYEVDVDSGYYAVKCTSCFVNNEFFHTSPDKAISKWNTRPTPPLEAQQGEEGYTWRLCGKEDKVLSNVITATTKAIAENPELFGYSRPSQSASREIKWPEKFKEANNDHTSAWNRAIDACKSAVSSAPKLNLDEREFYNEFANYSKPIGGNSFIRKITVQDFDKFYKAVANKFATKAFIESNQRALKPLNKDLIRTLTKKHWDATGHPQHQYPELVEKFVEDVYNTFGK